VSKARNHRRLGSARLWRVGFGDTPKQAFIEFLPSQQEGLHTKSTMARTPSPARVTRALPGKPRSQLFLLGFALFLQPTHFRGKLFLE
jgi:hypothetical protein